jgi:hypothetical protein
MSRLKCCPCACVEQHRRLAYLTYPDTVRPIRCRLLALRVISLVRPGQKATAVLLVLLLESDTPLLVDQLEDDPDNLFIADV